MPSSLLVLAASDIERIVSTFSPADLMSLMAETFQLISTKPSLSNGLVAYTPHRTSIPSRNHTILFMPARVIVQDQNDSGLLSGTTIKVVSVPQSPTDTRGLPASTLVLDEETGSVKAIINARNLTALRTAAGSLLSTTLVGPREPTSIVAFGTGKQIQAHLALHLAHFPSISNCTVFYRSTTRIEELKASIENRFASVQFTYLPTQNDTDDLSAQRIEEVLLRASVIVCATPSKRPLFRSEWVRTGTHVILVGSFKPEMKEIERDLLMRAVPRCSNETEATTNTNIRTGQGRNRPACILLVDSRSACQAEAGEIIEAQLRDNDMVEIGAAIGMFPQCVSDSKSPDNVSGSAGNQDQSTQGPITIFKSVGLGIQDVAISCAVVRKAEEMGDVGTRVLDYDTLYGSA